MFLSFGEAGDFLGSMGKFVLILGLLGLIWQLLPFILIVGVVLFVVWRIRRGL